MSERPLLLKLLLRERHWQNYGTFCAEYDKAAARIDPDLAGSCPQPRPAAPLAHRLPAQPALPRPLPRPGGNAPRLDRRTALPARQPRPAPPQRPDPQPADRAGHRQDRPYSPRPQSGCAPSSSRPSPPSTSPSTSPDSPARPSTAPSRNRSTTSASAASSPPR